MDNQYGGVKRKVYDPDSQDFTPIYNMVNAANSKLSVLTTDSLKGFMLNLTVDKEDSEYLNLRGKRFTEPVTNFILKFVILTDIPSRDLGYYNGTHKSSESHESFFNEAKLQQYIWKESITFGRPAICPSVANLSMFTAEDSLSLMNFFKESNANNYQIDTTSESPNPITHNSDVFRFLSNKSQISKPDRGIGLLVMPTITQSTTLSQFMGLPINSNFYGKIITYADKFNAVSNAFAQIARLFVEIGVVHVDLHSGNIMIYLNSEQEIKCSLIDFGRASNILSEDDDIYLTKEQKEGVKLVIKDFKKDLFDLDKEHKDLLKLNQRRKMLFELSRDQNNFLEFNKYRDELMQINAVRDEIRINEINYMKYVLDYIADFDFSINNPKYFDDDGITYQLKWFAQYRNYDHLTDNRKKGQYMELFVNAFDILHNMTLLDGNSAGISADTIKTYERDGSFINLNTTEGIDAFIVPFPHPVPVDTLPLPEEHNVSADTVPLPEQDAITAETKRRRTVGGRKNKLHKTNKRKNGKSKRNRRNKNKNTRKKR
jgi:hypothetical protein